MKKLFLILLTFIGSSYLGATEDSPTESIPEYVIEVSATGVSISPSRLRFNAKPGAIEKAKVKIFNNTDQPKSFRMKFNDFNMNEYGKSQFVAPGNGKYGISNWISVAPSFIELGPNEKKEVEVTLDVPTDEAGNKAAWGIMMIEEAEERKTFNTTENGESIAFGIIPTLAFGVFIYQNPPGVTVNDLEIIDFKVDQIEERNFVNIDTKNLGTGIAYCKAYVELTNLNTGFQEKLLVKAFTIVPELTRTFNFELPANLEKGKYSAVGVIDYGSDEEIEAAELEFEIK